MKKYLFNIGLIVMLLGTILLGSGNAITTSANTYKSGDVEDKYAPTCSISISSTVSLRQVRTGMISCVDFGEFNDITIVPSDIVAYGGLIKKIKILSVGEPMKTDENTYVWNFTYKATFIGRTTVYLNGNAVSDASGNGNWASQSQQVKVTLR